MYACIMYLSPSYLYSNSTTTSWLQCVNSRVSTLHTLEFCCSELDTLRGRDSHIIGPRPASYACINNFLVLVIMNMI